jgi:hypothetical protein
MLRDIPSPQLPNAPSACCVEANALDDALDMMLFNQTTASNNVLVVILAAQTQKMHSRCLALMKGG